jgi:hypothetical protein
MFCNQYIAVVAGLDPATHEKQEKTKQARVSQRAAPGFGAASKHSAQH